MADREQRRAALEPARRARRQAGRRVRRQGRLHRPGRERRADRAPGRGDPAPAGALDRAGAGAALDLPDGGARRRARRAPRRPAPVRGLRRGHPHRPRRAHARRAARGLDDRQLLPGRRLEGHVGARGGAAPARRPGDARPPRRGRRPSCPACARAASGRASSNSSSSRADARPDRARAVLDRPPARARRAHRAHARRRLPRRRAGPAATTPACGCPGTRCWRSWAPSGRTGRPTRDEVVQRLTLDRTNATSVASCVTQAREGARTVRDVFSAEMWEAINTFHLGLLRRDNSAALRTGPVLGLRVRQGALRPVLGRDRADDAARRGARVPRGRRADRGRRHGAADAARRAAGRERGRRRPPRARRPGARAAAGGRRLPGVPARGAGAAQRAARSGASCSTSAPTPTPSPRRCSRCTRRSPRPTPTTATRRRCCGSAGCRPTSTSARARSTARPAASTPMLGHVQQELAQVDADIAQRYFGGASPPVPRLATP